jgi:hypothetical protein
MNNSNLTRLGALDADALQARFARRVAARLHEQAERAGSDIDERLRFARGQALERARAARAAAAQSAPAAVGGPVLALTGETGGTPWWARVAVLLPVLLLIAGFTLIQQRHSQAQIDAAAEIDAALLSDDLPPTAYTDPGFVEFLRAPQD